MRSRSLLPLPLLAAAVLLTGCVSISSVSTSQPQSMGPVRLSVSACASDSAGCPSSPSGASLYRFLQGFAEDDDTLAGQPLVAIRLPEQAVPPASFTATVAGGRTLSFTRSTSYESELEAFEPAPAGERWWGWLGGKVDYGLRTAQSFAFSVQVPLPRPADGGALPSPMRWRPIAGVRQVSPELPAGRPVDCGASVQDLYDGFIEAGSYDSVICVSSTSPDALRGYLDAPIVDFGLTGTTVVASPSATTTATFVAARSGVADPATSFALAVAGGPPGASVELSRTTVSLRDAATPVLATVAVPAGTAPGSYPVTLTATAPGKPERTAVATVVVPTPPETPREPPVAPPVAPPGGGGAGGPGGSGPGAARAPTLTAALTPARFRAGARVAPARRGRAAVGTTIRATLSKPATVRIAVERTVAGRRAKGRCVAGARRGTRCRTRQRVGTITRALPAGTTRIAFTGRVGRRTLAPGRYSVTLVASDAAGRSPPRTFAVTIVRR